MRKSIKTLIRDLANPERGYGFIASEDEKKDYYFNHLSLIDCKYSELFEGVIVEFDVLGEDSERKAVNIHIDRDCTANQIITQKDISGVIRKLVPDSEDTERGYGFIADEKQNYYFNRFSLTGCKYSEVSEGMAVEFDAVEIGEKRKAVNIRLLKKEIVAEAKKSQTCGFNNTIKMLTDILHDSAQASESEVFEDIVFLILKILGIHTLFQYDRKSQAGRADGFFIIENLAVIYDCSLREDYYNFKKEQIENYVAKLSNKSQITIEIRKTDGGSIPKTLKISGKNKQVWLITRGNSRELEDNDGVKVKEVAVSDLIELIRKRLLEYVYDQQSLSGELWLVSNELILA